MTKHDQSKPEWFVKGWHEETPKKEVENWKNFVANLKEKKKL